MTLASDIAQKSIVQPVKAYKPAKTGRPAGCADEDGKPESSHSIGARYKCSYGKILWLFKKHDSHEEVYAALKAKTPCNAR